MRISGFVWRADVIDKLAWKHQVEIHEVIEVFANSPQFERLERGHRPGEDLYVASGQTNSGRYLTILYIHKQDDQALIVTARTMTTKERRRYAKN